MAYQPIINGGTSVETLLLPELPMSPQPAPQATALGYCGICGEFYEYRVEEAQPVVRCPLCGYYSGDC